MEATSGWHTVVSEEPPQDAGSEDEAGAEVSEGRCISRRGMYRSLRSGANGAQYACDAKGIERAGRSYEGAGEATQPK